MIDDSETTMDESSDGQNRHTATVSPAAAVGQQLGLHGGARTDLCPATEVTA